MTERVTLLEQTRRFVCAICERALEAESVTSTHPECPELVRIKTHVGEAEYRPWIGIVDGEPGEPPSLLVLCSRRCAEAFIEAGG
jgi:hypothetical protein